MKRNFVSKIFILTGAALIIFSGYLYYQKIVPRNLSFSHYYQSDYSNSKEKYPVWLNIKSLDINLPVSQSKIYKNNWESAKESISFLASSTTPGEVGNSIFYGHNWPNLLGNLNYAKKGQEIEVILSDNTTMIFVIRNIFIVNPDQVSILARGNEKKLTIYTCTGFLDSKRIVVIAVAKK